MTQTIDEELLVKSRHRVKAHGEVFTPRRMVDQMLDLVSEDLETGPGFVDKVRAAIAKAESEGGRTITLSVGQLTTGVTVSRSGPP